MLLCYFLDSPPPSSIRPWLHVLCNKEQRSGLEGNVSILTNPPTPLEQRNPRVRDKEIYQLDIQLIRQIWVHHLDWTAHDVFTKKKKMLKGQISGRRKIKTRMRRKRKVISVTFFFLTAYNTHPRPPPQKKLFHFVF